VVKINKRPVPPKPIKKTKDYQNDPNFSALKEDCFNKCYICEYDKATTLQVEHRISRKKEISLKYEWNNLFLSCGHCNSIKLDKYDSVLDPSECDPEEYISLSLANVPNEVIVDVLLVDISAEDTAKLLRYVYNGGLTAIKDAESEKLRRALIECICKFIKIIENYKKEPSEGYDELIVEEISRSSAFAAFKRKIIRDDIELSIKFSSYL
jgi:hypothetical protein